MGKKKSKKSAEEKPDSLVARTKYDTTYDLEEVHRRQITNAPYNPRVITDKAKQAIKRKLEQVGLVAPITWNKRTGNIVGGHQRLACIDALMGGEDYKIRVASVDMDEQTERETNVFLNNPEAQGDWDLGLLDKLIREDKIDIESAGFDVGDIYALLGDSPLAGNADQLTEMSEKLKNARDAVDAMRQASNGLDDYEYYSVIVFAGDADRAKFNRFIGIEENSQYIDGRGVWKLFKDAGIDVDSDDGIQPDFIRTIKRCESCGCIHESLEFYPLILKSAAADATHYAICPVTGTPLISIRQDTDAEIVADVDDVNESDGDDE